MDHSNSDPEQERLSPELAKELIDMIESVEKEEADQVGASAAPED